MNSISEFAYLPTPKEFKISKISIEGFQRHVKSQFIWYSNENANQIRSLDKHLFALEMTHCVSSSRASINNMVNANNMVSLY